MDVSHLPEQPTGVPVCTPGIVALDGLDAVHHAALLCLLSKSPDGIVIPAGHLHAKDQALTVIRTPDDLERHLGALKPDDRTRAIRRLQEITQQVLSSTMPS